MFTSILILALIFIAGLLTTNLPTKKFFAWFISLSVKNHSQAVVSIKTAEKKTEKRVSCTNKDEIKRVFATFDKNNDGYITKRELRVSLKNIGMALEEADIMDLIKSVDTNQDGLIDLNEFCECFASLLGRGDQTTTTTKGDQGRQEADHERNEYEEEDEDLKEAFSVFDEDKDGLITVAELGSVLCSLGFGQGNREEECCKMIKNVDMDGDGMVNFDEFKKMTKNSPVFVPIP